MKTPKHTSLLLLLLFLFPGITSLSLHSQTVLDLETEVAGTYLPDKVDNFTFYVKDLNSEYMTRGVTIEKSTTHIGKFKFTMADQVIKPANGLPHVNLENIVLDGVTINTDGTIPQQDIRTKAKTENEENIKFSIEALKGNGIDPASFITKDASDPENIKYQLRFEIKTTLNYGAKSAETKLVYRDMTQGEPAKLAEFNSKNLGEYKGNLYWGLIMMDSGNLPDYQINIEEGTKENSYNLTMSAINFTTGGRSVSIPKLKVENLQIDENGKFFEREFTIKDIHVVIKLDYNAKILEPTSIMRNDSLRLEILTEARKFYGNSYQVKMHYKGEKTYKEAPAAVSGFTIVPDASGKNEATLSFTAPTTDTIGKPLTDLSSLRIFRQDDDHKYHLIHEIKEAEKGKSYSWTDKDAHNGENRYRVTAYSSIYGMGTPSSSSAFVGTDIPEEIKNLSLKVEGNNAVVSWDKPEGTGIKKQPVYAESVCYKIVRNDGEVIAEKLIGVTSFTDTTIPADQQSFVFYKIYPFNSVSKGKASETAKHFSFGPAMEVPFKESFVGGEFQNKAWGLDMLKTNPSSGKWVAAKIIYKDFRPWRPKPGQIIEEAYAQDADSGLVVLQDSWGPGDGMRLISPAIKIKSLTKVELSFWLYQEKESTSKLEVEISVDNTDFVPLKEIKVGGTENSGWVQHTLSLDEYTKAEKISLGFKGIYTTGGHRDFFAIDNLSVNGEKSTTDLISSEREDSEISIYSQNKNIIIKGAANKSIRIYSIEGSLVENLIGEEATEISLKQGVYFVEIEGKTEKIFVR